MKKTLIAALFALLAAPAFAAPGAYTLDVNTKEAAAPQEEEASIQAWRGEKPGQQQAQAGEEQAQGKGVKKCCKAQKARGKGMKKHHGRKGGKGKAAEAPAATPATPAAPAAEQAPAN